MGHFSLKKAAIIACPCYNDAVISGGLKGANLGCAIAPHNTLVWSYVAVAISAQIQIPWLADVSVNCE